MKTISGWLFTLLCLALLFRVSFGTSCLNTWSDGTPFDVDSWLIVTPPSLQIDGVNYGFYAAYRTDPREDYQWTFPAFGANDANAVAQIEYMFNAHVSAAANKNTELLDYHQKKNVRPDTEKIDGAPSLKVFQIWLQNDLYDNCPMCKKILKLFEKDDMYFKAAHSKWLLTIDFTDPNNVHGYIIMHSVTKIPHDLYPNANNFKAPIRLFNNENPLNRFFPSQHIFCMNLRKDAMLVAVGILYSMYPPISHVNFHYDYWPDIDDIQFRRVKTLMKELISNPTEVFNVYQTHIQLIGKRCYADYNDHKQTPKDYHLCRKEHTDTLGGFRMRLYRPTPQIYVGDPVAGTKLIDSDALGPFPWSDTAILERSDLCLSHFRRVLNFQHWGAILPNRQSAVHKIIEITNRKVSINQGHSEMSWDGTKTHDKIGISRTKNLVCVGDANHFHTQVHHSGVIICVNSKALAFMRTWVTGTYDLQRSINGDEMKQLKTKIYANKDVLEAILPQNDNNNNNDKPKQQSKLDRFVIKKNERNEHHGEKRSRSHDGEDDDTRMHKKAKISNTNNDIVQKAIKEEKEEEF